MGEGRPTACRATSRVQPHRVLAESGFTLIEALVTVAVAALVLAGAAVLAGPMIARESMRSDIALLQSTVKRARMESVSRNRACHFLVDASSGRVLVSDTMGTGTSTDDRVVLATRVSSRSIFAAPDGSSPVTFENPTADWHRVTFSADGAVSAGTGRVVLRGADQFSRLSVFAGGGTSLSRWNGTSWTP